MKVFESHKAVRVGRKIVVEIMLLASCVSTSFYDNNIEIVGETVIANRYVRTGE